MKAGHLLLLSPSLAALLGAAAVLAAPSSARAYREPSRFDEGIIAAEPAGAHGGGAGRHFTGSPTDGHTCGVCHGDDDVPLPLTGLPELGYRPREPYLLTMDLGTGAGAVGGSLEVTDGAGVSLGTLEALTEDELEDADRCTSGGVATEGATAIYGVGVERAIASTTACGARVTRARWTAPSPGSGPAFVYGVSVRGNSSGTTDGDSVGHFSVSVPVEGAPPTEIVLDGGCGAAGPRDATPLPILGLWMVACVGRGWGRGRSRFRRHGR
ncbi:MAG: hypothetical protein JRH11_10915 [Deltaproteobacteria bacterium]|nr:hypothetical protein [Deltaproteobacteria bacterium]